MKEFIKIFGVVLGGILGIVAFVYGMFWILIKVVNFRMWLIFPILILVFAFWGASMIYSVKNY